MVLDTLTSIAIIVSSIVGTSLLASLLLSTRFCMRLLKGFLNDYAKFLTFSEMGESSGDTRYRSKVEGILEDSMGGIVSRVVSDNPIVQTVLEYLVTETEIGDLLKDPRTLPIILSFAQKNLDGGGLDLSSILGDMTGPKSDESEGYGYG